MSTPHNVLTGLWTDYSRGGRTQILQTDFWAQWMKTMVAVGLTLSGPYVFAILQSFFLWSKTWWDQDAANPERRHLLDPERLENAEVTREGDTSQHSANTTQADGAQRETEAHQNGDVHRADEREPRDEESVFDIFRRSKGGRETMKNLIEDALQKGAKISGSHTILMIMIGTSILVVFVAQIIANVFSAKVVTDRAARSSSTHCGIWIFDENAGDDAAARADLYNYQKEARAAEYAQNCYGSQIATDSARCDFFYNSSLGFTSKRLQECPFGSYELCLGGLYSAVTFDTGLIDASYNGINSKITHKFRRKTTCSPLNMDYPYVRNESSQDSNNATYYYYYGSINDDTAVPVTTINYTYKTSGHPFYWLAPVYSVNTYPTSLYPEWDYYRPIPKLRPPENSTLTIIFVSSMHIYHLKPSYDPIFPATEPRYMEGYHDPFYYNSDPKARALACVDTTELCSPDGKICWSMTAQLPDSVPNTPAYWLMKWSLENSNTYDSIKWRLGTALLAQQKVSQSISQPLGDNHWEEEARRLFETSLARIQFDAWGIARGEDREQPGSIEITPDEGRGKLCKIYKFNSIGYTNIGLFQFIGLLLTPWVVIFLSLEAKRVKNFFSPCFCYPKAPSNGDGIGKTPWEPLVVNVVVKYLARLLWCLPRGLFLSASWLYNKLR